MWVGMPILKGDNVLSNKIFGDAAAFNGAGRWRRLLAGVTAGLLALSGVSATLLAAPTAAQAAPTPSAEESGYDYMFLVDDVRDIKDKSLADGKCETNFTATFPSATAATPTCTFYAAIEEANALPAGSSILIAPAPSIRQIDGTFGSTGLIDLQWNTTNNPNNPNAAGRATEMSTSMVTNAGIAAQIDADNASRYWIKHNNVTIDFQHRYGWKLASDSGVDNVLLFTGKDQTFRNFTDLTSAEGGIYVGTTAENFTVANGRIGNLAVSSSAAYAIERGLVIVAGAKNTTASNITFQRNYWDAVLLAPSSTAGRVIDGLTIDRSLWDQPANVGGYDPVYNFFVRNWNANVSGRNIKITNNTIQNWGNDGGASNVINIDGGTWSNVNIQSNAFKRTVNQAVQAIYLNNVATTAFDVRGNTFTSTVAKGSGYGYSWIYTNGTTSGVKIYDNNFVGGGSTGQIMNLSGTSTRNPIYRNVMSGVANSAGTNENNGNYDLDANNIRQGWYGANNRVRTAYPSAASVPNGVTPPPCVINVTVQKPQTGTDNVTNGNAIPTDPIYVDAYLGVSSNGGLSQYLGRVVTAQSELPKTFAFPYTGAGNGNVVRLQTTEIATGNTSQYSRSVTATGADECGP